MTNPEEIDKTRLEEQVKASVLTIWFLRIVRWPRRLLEYILNDKKTSDYRLDFYGIGIGGWYIGFLNGRRSKIVSGKE